MLKLEALNSIMYEVIKDHDLVMIITSIVYHTF